MRYGEHLNRWTPAGGRVRIYDIDKAELVELPEIGARGGDWAPSEDNLAIVVGDPAGRAISIRNYNYKICIL